MRTLLSLTLIACVVIGAAFSPAQADEQLALDIAGARAEAIILVAKATKSQPCVSVECRAAETKAAKFVQDATLQLQQPKQPQQTKQLSASISADGQTLTDSCGRVYRRLPNGVFTPQDSKTPPASGAGTGCRMVNGQWMCPQQR